MLWFPSIVRQAVYMTANHENGDEKWWVGAEDGKGRLITAWSQRPETPHIIAQLKFSTRTGALNDKADEKVGKGYIQETKWHATQRRWLGLLQTPGVPMMPPGAPSDGTNILQDEMIASVKLAGKVSSPKEIVRLELCKEPGFASEAVRLDHYEHHHSEVVDYPLWQTVYQNVAAAEATIESVIENRQKIGYAVEEKDMSRLSTAFMQGTVINLTIPGAHTLIWDF